MAREVVTLALILSGTQELVRDVSVAELTGNSGCEAVKVNIDVSWQFPCLASKGETFRK